MLAPEPMQVPPTGKSYQLNVPMPEDVSVAFCPSHTETLGAFGALGGTQVLSTFTVTESEEEQLKGLVTLTE